MRQALHHWEHLLNTPSASITDEPDLKSVRNRLRAGQIKVKNLENRPA